MKTCRSRDLTEQQAWLIHEEREKQLFDALEKTRRGSVVCVFDITDRLQHMFWRYLEPDHPANAGKDVELHRDAIRELYTRMDDLVGRVMAEVGEDTPLVVMSDHGFKSFRRGVNLNSWLQQNGYMTLKDGRPWCVLEEARQRRVLILCTEDRAADIRIRLEQHYRAVSQMKKGTPLHRYDPPTGDNRARVNPQHPLTPPT